MQQLQLQQSCPRATLASHQKYALDPAVAAHESVLQLLLALLGS
jgi:hypothetical protein